MNKRIDWLDMAKGYGIILVILSHLNTGIFKTWIFSFHMPLFFILSGFVFNSKYDFKTFIKKKLKTLILPYYLLGIIPLLFIIITENLDKANSLKLVLRFLYQIKMWPIWFLPCLFLINILFYLIEKNNKDILKLALICLFTPILGIIYYHFTSNGLFWNFDVSLMALPFFFLGYLLKKYEHLIQEKITSKNKLLISSILLTINILTLILNIKLSNQNLDMLWNSYGFILLSYISAISGSLFIICISKITNLKSIKFIGKNTLIYLALHQQILIPISNQILMKINNEYILNSQVLYVVLQMVIILVPLTLITILINNSKLKFIVGK